MPSGTFNVMATPLAFGPFVAHVPSLLGGAGSFLIAVEADSISDAVGPILGQLDYWDTQDRFRSDTFFDSIRVTASGRSAFTPKIRFKSLTVNGQIVRGRWSIAASP